jgi:hypothetical protein
MIKPSGNVLELPLEQRAEMALKAAVEKVIVEHSRQGLQSIYGAMAKSWRCRSKNCASVLRAFVLIGRQTTL